MLKYNTTCYKYDFLNPCLNYQTVHTEVSIFILFAENYILPSNYYLKSARLSQLLTWNTYRYVPVCQMVSDRLFVVEVERAARMQAAARISPVYFYRFSYRGKHSYSEMMSWGSTENFGKSLGWIKILLSYIWC